MFIWGLRFKKVGRPRHAALAAGLSVSLLSGCVSYTPLELPSSPALASEVASLPSSATLRAPLGVEDLVALALANNPDLKAARLRRGVAAGQTKQASILPNPSLSTAFLPLLSGAGTVPAWSIGLSQDIKALVTYKSRRRSALDSERQVSADVVWQEWQVAGKARQLAVDLILSEHSRPIYSEQVVLLADRSARLERALAEGNVTLSIVAPDRVALQGARSALASVDQNRLSLRHQLNALLGLEPDAALRLAEAINLPPFDRDAIREGLPTLGQRRPDLLALRFGYAAADENLRQAIAAQFPDLVFGGSAASDNSKVVNGGPNVTLGLPVFDRNQGNIAIATATRAQLKAEYAARLAAATGEVGALLAEHDQLAAQLASARESLPQLEAAAERARAAFGRAAIDERAYLDLATNYYVRQQEIVTLETALLDRQVAIQTLVGAGLPTADVPLKAGAGN